MTDLNGMIREANWAAATLLGIPQEFLVNKPLVNYVVDADRRTFRNKLSELPSLRRLTDWEIKMQPRKREPFPVRSPFQRFVTQQVKFLTCAGSFAISVGSSRQRQSFAISLPQKGSSANSNLGLFKPFPMSFALPWQSSVLRPKLWSITAIS